MSKSWLPRYISGEHEEVWTELWNLGPAVRGTPCEEDAWRVAHETMRRVRLNIEMIVERLTNSGYQFVEMVSGGKYPPQPYVPPDSESASFVSWLEELTGPLPITLASWILNVGDVSLLGFHPDWPEEDMMTDALVVELECKAYADRGQGWDARSYFTSELETWKESVARSGLSEDVGPFSLPFAPDSFHKVNVSGGPPYGIYLPDTSADAKCSIGDNEIDFVAYLRECFRWGGFPGVSELPEVREDQLFKRLSEGLLPI